MALALDSRAEPFDIVNVTFNNPSRCNDTSWVHRESDSPRFDITIVVVNPDNLFNVAAAFSSKVFQNRYVIAYWFWELPQIPDEWLPAFSLVDEVWGASRFVEDALMLKSPVPVYRVPIALSVPRSISLARSYFDLPENTFLFINTCDTQSYLERKNPAGAIRAFKEAFASTDRSVALVVKINNPDNQPQDVEALRELAADYPNILFIEKIMTREEIAGLVAVCDSYISLHRSEGFGLGPAEAMSLGKPVIATDWSGNVDYMTPHNSYGVDYSIVKVGGNFGPYAADQCWAEPNLDDAAAGMRRIVAEPEYAERLGLEARRTIRATLAPEVVGRRIAERLRYIRAAL